MKYLKGFGLRKYAVVRALIRWSMPRKCTNDGHIFYLNPADNVITPAVARGAYEPDETALCKRRIKNGETVIDIGANIGYFTLLFARLVGKEGKVFAFEPDPTNFRLLEKNVKANGYTNVVCFPTALTDYNGQHELFLHDYNMGDHRLYDSGTAREKVAVTVARLDDVLPDVSPSFVKIDIQGSEYLMVQGAKNTLAHAKELLIEYWPYGLEKAGTTGAALQQALQELNFHWPDQSNLDRFTPENREFTNIHATKKT